MRHSWETMTSVSAGHIIQTPTQPVGSGRPQRESNPGPPQQESRALPQSYPPPHNNNSNIAEAGESERVGERERKRGGERGRHKLRNSEREKSGCVKVMQGGEPSD